VSRTGRFGLNVAVFLLALCAAALGVRRALARLGADELQEAGVTRFKLDTYARHAADYELVFIGSSRMYRQVDPEVFDDALARRGFSTSSYNLGLPGMWFYEVLYRANRIAVRAPAALRWMVIELQDPDPGDEPLNQNSQRTIAWHTPRYTWIACRTELASERSLLERLSSAGGHLVQGFMNALNLGLLTSALDRGTVPLEFREHAELGRTGYMPLDLEPAERVRRGRLVRALLKEPRYLERQVELHRAAGAVAAPSGLFTNLARLVGELRQHGIEPIFVLLPPSSRTRTEIVAAHENGVLPNLIDLEDPGRFPEFYLEPALRFDKHHLNQRGAERLTRLLAAACFPILSTPRDRPRRP